MLPKRVGVPKMMASEAAKSSVWHTGTWAWAFCAESAHLRQDVFREGFRNAADPDLGTSHAARPFSYRLPQPVDMAVHRVIDNQYFHNASPFLFEINVLLAVSGRNHHMRPVSMPVKIGMSN